ncbi:MAG: diacylglycerol kinase family lipid kinase [Anaerolineae bacterium]|nr:MAG: diacylglycerol kinase family lipid kinase [Anaerolineae bacterium]
MKIKIIVNPYANRWNGRKKIPDISKAFQDIGLDHDLYVLPAAGLGSLAAQRSAEEGYDVVVAAGGDGTVNEVVNGLIAFSGDRPTIPLGVLPIGTGNDFNDMSGLPRDLHESAKLIAAGRTKQVDAGQVTIDGSRHYFGNNCALAMEPMVTIENINIKRLSGNIRYIVALLIALRKLKAWHFSFSWSGGSFEGSIILLSVCNSPRTGGVFPMSPNALMDDGLFDVVWALDMPLRNVLMLLPKLFRGTHLQHPDVSRKQTDRLEVRSSPGTPVHADGEVISRSATHLLFEVLPGKITVITK